MKNTALAALLCTLMASFVWASTLSFDNQQKTSSSELIGLTDFFGGSSLDQHDSAHTDLRSESIVYAMAPKRKGKGRGRHRPPVAKKYHGQGHGHGHGHGHGDGDSDDGKKGKGKKGKGK